MDINDLGLDLLMNKKKIPSDSMSVISRSSAGGRSIASQKPRIVSVENTDVDDEDDDDGGDVADYDDDVEDEDEDEMAAGGGIDELLR